MKTDIPDSKHMQSWLFKYFPEALRETYEKEILSHQLKREIVATMLASAIINRMGPTFVLGQMEKCNVSSSEVARAYAIVRRAFSLKDIWTRIEELDNEVPAQVQLKAMKEISRMSERSISWFLTRFGQKLNIEREISAYEDGIKTLRKNMNSVVTKAQREKITTTAQRNINDGLPKALAQDIAMTPLLSSACDIIRIAAKQKTDITITAKIYFELGEYFHLDWMRQQARYMPANDRWTGDALNGLIDQLYACQAGITVRILKDLNGKSSKATNGKNTILKDWIAKHGDNAAQIEPLFQDLRNSNQLDLSMLIIAEQRLRSLSDH